MGTPPVFARILRSEAHFAVESNFTIYDSQDLLRAIIIKEMQLTEMFTTQTSF
jgi:hypothetical protein